MEQQTMKFSLKQKNFNFNIPIGQVSLKIKLKMKKGILLAVLLMVAQLASSQTWSHTRSYLNKDGGWNVEKLSDVKEVEVDFENNLVFGFVYYNLTDDAKGRMRFTPTCNCKRIDEEVAQQFFTADDGKKTRVVLDWEIDGRYFNYIVYKLKGKNFVQVSTESFVKNK